MVDDLNYFELSETGGVAGGSSDIVALHRDGVRQQFHVTGSQTALPRIR